MSNEDRHILPHAVGRFCQYSVMIGLEETLTILQIRQSADNSFSILINDAEQYPKDDVVVRQ